MGMARTSDGRTAAWISKTSLWPESMGTTFIRWPTLSRPRPIRFDSRPVFIREPSVKTRAVLAIGESVAAGTHRPTRCCFPRTEPVPRDLVFGDKKRIRSSFTSRSVNLPLRRMSVPPQSSSNVREPHRRGVFSNHIAGLELRSRGVHGRQVRQASDL